MGHVTLYDKAYVAVTKGVAIIPSAASQHAHFREKCNDAVTSCLESIEHALGASLKYIIQNMKFFVVQQIEIQSEEEIQAAEPVPQDSQVMVPPPADVPAPAEEAAKQPGEVQSSEEKVPVTEDQSHAAPIAKPSDSEDVHKPEGNALETLTTAGDAATSRGNATDLSEKAQPSPGPGPEPTHVVADDETGIESDPTPQDMSRSESTAALATATAPVTPPKLLEQYVMDFMQKVKQDTTMLPFLPFQLRSFVRYIGDIIAVADKGLRPETTPPSVVPSMQDIIQTLTMCESNRDVNRVPSESLRGLVRSLATAHVQLG